MSRSVASQIEEAFRAPVHGWDFSWLDGRAQETRPPWDYMALARSAVLHSDRALDIDTGGGEFLERLRAPHSDLVATEGYGPNVAVAAERLALLRIPVVHAASAPDNADQGDGDPWANGSPLPFSDSAFDLVSSRHSSYWPSEVSRVLKPGGRFLTQQRSEAGREGEAWEDVFQRPTHPHARFDLAFASQQLREHGFHIVRAEEADTPMLFMDLAGVVFYLRLVPWAVENFDPNDDLEALELVQRRLMAEGVLRIRGSHMLLDCMKR